MRADVALQRVGGVADAATLLGLVGRSQVRRAVLRGDVVRDQRGRYSLPGVEEALRRANGLTGVLVEDSAAQYHGWEMKHRPVSPCVAVPRTRKVPAERRRGARVRWVDLAPDDVSRAATRPAATVVQCAARMPFDEALAIADSALRHQDVEPTELLRRAEAMPDRYRARVLRVVEAADGRAANPFESVLRAIALDVPGLDLEPQVWVDGIGRPDLLDRRLRVVVEADSFEFHGRRAALKHDCERYNAFVADGWVVVRFSWEHVMFDPDYVRRVLMSLVAGPVGHALGGLELRRPA